MPSKAPKPCGNARVLGALEPEEDGGAIRLVRSPKAWLREGERQVAAAERLAEEVLPPKSKATECFIIRAHWF